MTSSLAGTTMTFSQATDAMQKVTLEGWATQSGAITDFEEWKTATASTLAQAKASRAEVWKTAGLDTA